MSTEREGVTMSALTPQARYRVDGSIRVKDDLAPQSNAMIMRILIAGTGGMTGSAGVPYLASRGQEVAHLAKRAPGVGEVRRDPDVGTIDAAGLEGFGVVHVASMQQARWTADFGKRRRKYLL